MEKYHGCPYVLGIDIFPLDYISRDKDECQFHLEVINIILGAIDAVTSSDITEQELDSYLVQVEQLTGVTIDRKVPVKLSLMRLAEKLCSIYGTDDADEVAGIWRLIWQENFHFPKEWFDDLIEVPFETVTIPVPKEYDRILKIKYGDNYMTPIKKITHDYPFYKTQEKIISGRIKDGSVINIWLELITAYSKLSVTSYPSITFHLSISITLYFNSLHHCSFFEEYTITLNSLFCDNIAVIAVPTFPAPMIVITFFSFIIPSSPSLHN